MNNNNIPMNNNGSSIPTAPFNGHIAVGAPNSAQHNGEAMPSSAAVPNATPLDAAGLEARVEAQSKAAKAAARGAGNLQDPIARPVDKDGLPLARPIVYLSPGLLGAPPIEETNLPVLLKLIGAVHPAWAQQLELNYEQGLRHNKRELDDLDRLAREELASQNAEIERRNRALATLQDRLERERDQRTAPDRESLIALDAPLSQAHRAAAQAVAKTGGGYDPADPTDECVLRAKPLSLEVVAGFQGLPWTPTDDEKRIPEWALHVLKFGVGSAIGVSIGLLGHFYAADSMGQFPGQVVASLVLGYVAALGGGWAIRGLNARASERYWLARFGGFGPLFWMPSALFTVIVGLTLVAAEAAVETQGLLGTANLLGQNNGGAQLPWWMFTLVGLLLTVGYMGVMSVEGARDGRRDVVTNRARALQHEEFEPRAGDERANERVQVALEKLGEVREAIRAAFALQTRIGETAQPFDFKIERLETLKAAPHDALSPQWNERLRGAHDNWVGANGDWKSLLEELLHEVDPREGRARRTGIGHAQRGSQSTGKRRGLLAKLRDWWNDKRGR